MLTRKVGIVYSKEYMQLCCCSPKFGDRYEMVMHLIYAYRQMAPLLCLIPPLEWNSKGSMYKDLTAFHTREYVEALEKLQNIYNNNDKDDDDIQLTPDEELFFDQFGLAYDCPGFPGVFDYALAAVRGSLAAANALLHRHYQVVINWAGGWHHAKSNKASGFCYFNDIVLAIDRLSASQFETIQPPEAKRILYIDLDLHHGDGVEEAFFHDPHVVTFSVHHASPGFFPGTGAHEHFNETAQTATFLDGDGAGRFSAFNLPLDEGVDDTYWFEAVVPILDLLHKIVSPTFIVLQCGADCLSTDPYRVFRLTNTGVTTNSVYEFNTHNEASSGYLRAMQKILTWQTPTLVLGGGGYNFADTARLWTKITALIIEETQTKQLKLSSDIPIHCYLERYGPAFELDVSVLPHHVNRLSLDKIKHHQLRLFKQAVNYAELNKISYDYDQLCELFN